MTGPLLWATDIHLDHVRAPNAAASFGREIAAAHPDASGLLVTGDIGESDCIVALLEDLASGFDRPVYFVLGNHDYYRGSFADVDAKVRLAALEAPHLFWLSTANVHQGKWALVGSEGWYDARYGNEKSPLQLTDFRAIEDLFDALDDGHARFLSCIRARADSLAKELEARLLEAVATDVSAIVVATHVPPFVEACFYEGKTADRTWAPFFTSRATGAVLESVAARHPHVQFTVLCGHTHGQGTCRMTDNLVVYTGHAAYGYPTVCGIVHIDGDGGRVDIEPTKRTH